MTEPQRPNWLGAPRTLLDLWFVTVPIVYAYVYAYMWVFHSALEGNLPALNLMQLGDALPLAHMAVMMSFLGATIAQFSCLNVVSRQAGMAMWERVVWWVVLILVPPVAVPACYFMRMREALFDQDAPRLGPLPKFVRGFLQIFVDMCVFQIALFSVALAWFLVWVVGSPQWSKASAQPLFLVCFVFVFAGALWQIVAGVIFCLHRLFTTEESRPMRVAWTLFLLLMPPLGILAFYSRRLRRHFGAAD